MKHVRAARVGNLERAVKASRRGPQVAFLKAEPRRCPAEFILAPKRCQRRLGASVTGITFLRLFTLPDGQENRRHQPWIAIAAVHATTEAAINTRSGMTGDFADFAISIFPTRAGWQSDGIPDCEAEDCLCGSRPPRWPTCHPHDRYVASIARCHL